jgi:hypothetical protein
VPARKFKGKTPKLKGDIFDNTGPHDAANFQKVVKNIADYLQLEHGSNVPEAVRTLTLPPNSEIPDPPTTTLPGIDEYLWKEKHKNAVKFKENTQKAYVIIFHQCTPSLKNGLKATDLFPPIWSAQDLILLLKLIQSLCCSYDSKTQGVMATIGVHKILFTYYQKDGVDNHVFHTPCIRRCTLLRF